MIQKYKIINLLWNKVYKKIKFSMATKFNESLIGITDEWI